MCTRRRSARRRARAVALLAFAAGAAVSQPAAQTGRLFPSPAHSVGASSDAKQGVAAGDFNGDGLQDLAALNPEISGTTSLGVILGVGEGAFTPAATYAVGPPTNTLLSCDFNEDGCDDLACLTSASIRIFLGTRAGPLAPGVSIAVSAGPFVRLLAAGDIDGDGSLDLVHVFDHQFLPTRARAYLGQGDGTFVAGGSAVIAGALPEGIDVADFDVDGHDDVVLADPGLVRLWVVFGQAGGLLAVGPTTPTGAESPLSITAADVDGDGLPDVAWMNAALHVLRGLGDGTFTPLGDYPVSAFARAVGAAEFDVAGGIDLLLLGTPPGGVSVLLGQGDGSFVPAAATAASASGAKAYAVADLDGDGLKDVAASQSKTVSLLFGHGDGTFETSAEAGEGLKPSSLALADLDEDGLPDIVTASISEASVGVLLGQGDGTFVSGASAAVGLLPGGLAVGDIDGDQHQDLVTCNRGPSTVSVLRGQGNGSLLAASSWPTGLDPLCLAVADFDGDGRDDVFTANNENGATGSTTVLLGQPDGSLVSLGTQPFVQAPLSVAAGDFDRDGALDLAVDSLFSSAVQILLGQADGSFVPAASPAASDFVGQQVTVADLDADGHTDLLLAALLAPTQQKQSATVLRGHGDGSFGAPIACLSLASNANSVAVADVDGDDVPDLASTTGGVVAVHRGLGDGSFAFDCGYGSAFVPGFLVAADFDDDGHPDLATATGDRISVLLNRSGTAAPWSDLHGGLSGVLGVPMLAGTGTLETGSAGKLSLAGAKPSAATLLFVALGSAPAPFKGGVLVPLPPALVLPLATGPLGTLALAWPAWPAGLSGASLFFQHAIADSAAPKSVALSNALRSDVP